MKLPKTKVFSKFSDALEYAKNKNSIWSKKGYECVTRTVKKGTSVRLIKKKK